MGSGGTEGQHPQGPTLASSASDKQRAVTYMEQNLLPDTRSAGAMGEGGGVVHPPMTAPAPPPIFNAAKPDTGLSGLSAWATDSGLSSAMTVWRGQADRLMGRLQNELSALRGTKTLFLDQDTGAGNALTFGNPLVTNPLIGTNPALGTDPAVGNPLVTNPLIGTNPAAGANPLIGTNPAAGANPLLTSPPVSTNPASGTNPLGGTEPMVGTNPIFQPLPTSLDQM
ncbi:conserved hypothetical protein [Actinacidiphila cocklensis]|uniref:Uncharacterized protein n=2 Tax=Actinacidiphila cocklensis TaxID=887465 RepID=A0A9W4GQH8_9ACTN|nr:conserved hypothetical protein [Actinacidiphila cocklensis]